MACAFSTGLAGRFTLGRLFPPFHVEWLMDVNYLFFVIDSDCQLIPFQRIIEGPERHEMNAGETEGRQEGKAGPSGFRGCRWGWW
jgi:hypothetical protein